MTAVAVERRAGALPALGPALRAALAVYAVYAVLFMALAAAVSAAYPQYGGEISVPAWPPAAPYGAWLERVVLLPISRYDVLWYVGIAEQGYAYGPGSAAFHPLYPLLSGLAGRLLGGHYLMGAWLVAQLCCVAMLAMLYRLVLLDDGAPVAWRTLALLLGSPLGFAFLLPYGESLLLLGIVGALYAGRRGRWWCAGLAGAAAALTKQPGALVVLPLLWELWQQRRAQVRAQGIGPLLGPLAGVALVPLGLLAWLVYRGLFLGDAAFSWSDPLSVVRSVLLSPSYETVWVHTLGWPWVPFQLAIEQLRRDGALYLQINLLLVVAMTALALYAALRARPSYGIYSVVVLLLRLMIVYPFLPLMAAARHLTLIFPIFIQLARWAVRPTAALLILLVNTALWATIAGLFVRNAFVP